MAVRSKRLAIGVAGAGASATVYTVPTGYRTIIKTISAWNFAAGFNRLFINPNHAGSQIGILVVPVGAAGGLDEAKHVNVFQVLMEGDSIKADATSNGIYFMVSGAELLL